ncbi:uncharacterized protein CCOS01_00862 [Colletotrichum costaricense]|uniref:Secreted protein n=1 Tax=Colletotrichum costaricense TaxID=1209916 RepID=A0AAI9Z9V7_9PEZI|nr:uncharacterized protein CCOS01_00862 [Colletotrichum costaricense]KAK1539548.1 hypothetical protein CCOS01_00862 [Colletotrichum costaricense]
MMAWLWILLHAGAGLEACFPGFRLRHTSVMEGEQRTWDSFTKKCFASRMTLLSFPTQKHHLLLPLSHALLLPTAALFTNLLHAFLPVSCIWSRRTYTQTRSISFTFLDFQSHILQYALADWLTCLARIPP